MRRVPAAVVVTLAAAVAVGALAGCSDGRSDDAAGAPAPSSPTIGAGETESLCAATQAAGEPEMAEFQSAGMEFVAALGSEDGPAAEAALARTQQAGDRLAGVFRDHAAAADDPDLAAGLTDMAAAVEQLADDFADYDPADAESIPDISEFDRAGQALLELCEGW